MAKKHALLSPSGSGRWLECTAAPRLEENYPNEASAYAEEGTLAHEVAETLAKHVVNPRTKPGVKLQRIRGHKLYAPEMEDHGTGYADFIEGQIQMASEECQDVLTELEVKLDLTKYVPDGFGTADCIIVADDILQVIDYKYGKGVMVRAEDNPQMKLYALGALEKYGSLYDIDRVVMTIYQPRLGWCDSWSIAAEDLEEWGETVVKPKAKEAVEGSGTFSPSEEACRFCKARGDCRARGEAFTKLFDDNPPELLDTFTDEELAALLEKADGMSAWLKDLEARVFSGLMDGRPYPGWKLVEGRSNRKITDEAGVVKALKAEGYTGDQIYTKKLITITEIEKLAGKAWVKEALADFIEKPQGQPKIAPANDKRPEISPQEQVLGAFDK